MGPSRPQNDSDEKEEENENGVEPELKAYSYYYATGCIGVLQILAALLGLAVYRPLCDRRAFEDTDLVCTGVDAALVTVCLGVELALGVVLSLFGSLWSRLGQVIFFVFHALMTMAAFIWFVYLQVNHRSFTALPNTVLAFLAWNLLGTIMLIAFFKAGVPSGPRYEGESDDEDAENVARVEREEAEIRRERAAAARSHHRRRRRRPSPIEVPQYEADEMRALLLRQPVLRQQQRVAEQKRRSPSAEPVPGAPFPQEVTPIAPPKRSSMPREKSEQILSLSNPLTSTRNDGGASPTVSPTVPRVAAPPISIEASTAVPDALETQIVVCRTPARLVRQEHNADEAKILQLEPHEEDHW